MYIVFNGKAWEMVVGDSMEALQGFCMKPEMLMLLVEVGVDDVIQLQKMTELCGCPIVETEGKARELLAKQNERMTWKDKK